MTLSHLVAALAAVAIPAAASAAQAAPPWTAGGFDMPESAVVDTARDRIIVSVIGGDPTAADGDGRLVLLSMDGTVLDPDWVTGLNAPKGLAISGDTLVVADLTRVHDIDLASGAIRHSATHPDAVFLNDVTAGDDAVYVSDFMTDSIWRYQDGTLGLWLKDTRLNHPNGVLADGDRLLVGSWGQGLRDDFTTEAPGSLLAVDLRTRDVSVVAAGIGNIDGIARVGDSIIVSDWVTGALSATADDGATVRHIGQHPPGLADISAHGDTLYLPLMLDGKLAAVRYP